MAKDDVSNLKESRDILAEMQDNVQRYNKGLKDSNSFTQKMANNNAETLKAAIKLREAQALSKKQLGSIADLSKKINDGDIDKIKSARIQNDLQKKLENAKARGFTKEQKGLEIQLDMLANMDEAAKVQGRINKAKEAASGLDEAFGGMGKQILNMVANPLTAVVALLVAFNSQQESIAKQFGAIGVTEFRSELAGANQEFTKLGFSSDDTNKTISDLANNFGLSVVEASKLSESVAETAAATGMTLDDSTKLVGILTQTQGLSGDQANELIRSTQALAKANNVAPDKVLADVAGNTEQFAQFAKDGGENVLRAAIQARKLGISLDSVAKTAEGLLNFQDSLTKEIEASTLIGRQLNLQKARELALAGDLEGVQKEILKQVGTEAEFNEMNTLQRQALADAVGLQSSELQKLVSSEKEAVSLQGELAKQNIDEIVSEKAITATAGLIQDLKAMGMQLAETVGPAVNLVSQAIGVLAKGLEKIGGLMPLLIGYFGVLTAKMIMNRLATESNMMANLKSFNIKKAFMGLSVVENFQLGMNTNLKKQNAAAELAKQTQEKGGIAQLSTLLGMMYSYTASLVGNTIAKYKSATAEGVSTAAKNKGRLATMKSTAVEVANAIAKYFSAAASGSGVTLGFGTLALVAMASAAVGAMLMSMASAKSVGDLYSGKGPIVTTPQGQSFEGSVRDEVLMAPNIAGAAAGGGSTTDTSKLESKQNQTNDKLERVAAVLEGALSGPKPALARAMGSSVGDSVGSMA